MGICVTKPKRGNEISLKKDLKSTKLEAKKKFDRKQLAIMDIRISVEVSDAKFAMVQDKSKTKADMNFITAALMKHFIFNNLTDEQRDLVINHMKYYVLEPREVVFEQNSVGSVFFVVVHGKLEVLIDNKRVNVLRPQDSFGELALIHDTPRTATVITIEKSALWGVDRRTFRSTLEQINAQNYAENRRLLESIPVFQILNHGQMESLINSISTVMFTSGQEIVHEGELGDLLYIIKEGSVTCSVEGNELKTLEKGEYFGEQALLYNSVRTATITATENVKCLTIGGNELTNLFGTSLQLIIQKNSQRIAFDNNSYTKKLNKAQYENLMNCSEIMKLEDKQKIISAGTLKKDKIIFIIKGDLEDAEGEVVYRVFDVIGLEEAINNLDHTFRLDYFSKGETEIAVISNQDFFKSIGGDYYKVASNNDAIKLLKKIQLFKHLTESQLESLIEVLRPETYKSNQIIFSQNEPGESFFLIKSGKVDVIKDGMVVRSITKDDYFGERSLIFDKFRSATVRAKGEGNVECWVLYKSDFIRILDDKLKTFLLKRIDLQDDSIKLTDFQLVKPIGTGTFGNVFLVVHKTKKTLYALKCVDRRKIEAYEIEQSLILERKVMLEIDHILISKLIKTFKDSKRLYFLLEFIHGLNLFDVLRKLDVVVVSDAKFYTACIFSMLEHLHEREIIYRDLHPENIMIDDEGYPKLVDFGAAKFIKGRTYTIVGTPHYMAPEIISGHGYSLSCDYWSAGIMLYEFLYAMVPFGEQETDPYMVYELVQQGKLNFPPESDNKDKVKDLIAQLLSKNPATRIGGSFDNLKIHPWFIGINWEKLLKRELPTPYVPILPSIGNEVEAALKSRKTLDELITKIEKNEDIPKSRDKKMPPNWDEEFNG